MLISVYKIYDENKIHYLVQKYEEFHKYILC